VAVAPFALPPDFMADPGAAGLGSGLAAMLTTALVESQRFVVVERPALDALPLPGSALVVPEVEGPRAGGLHPHQLLLIGTVTEFTQSARESGFTLGLGLGSARVGLSPQTVTGRVALDIRAVDPATGQVVAAYSVRESFKAKGVSASLERGELSLGRSHLARTPVGEAARRAVQAAVARLSEALAGREWSGRVVDVEEGEVAINAGTAAGIRVGDRFLLYRTTRVLTDPVTGQVLGARRRVIGRLQVTAVEPQVAFGTVAGGAESLPQRGDTAVHLSE
jgi:curli biogenesis system outer membrane secretion channel CsgG